MKRTFLSAVIFLSATLSAQQVSTSSIIQMKEAGLSDEIIKNTIINANQPYFDVSPHTLIELKKMNISNEIINLMQKKNETVSTGELHRVSTGDNEQNETPISVHSLREENGILKFGDNGQLQKGDKIKVLLPYNNDNFSYIEEVKGNTKKFAKGLAGIVGNGALIVGGNTGNIKILTGAMKIYRTANNVMKTTELLEKIDELPISKSAKSIAGKTMEVKGWKRDGSNYILTAELGKKKYEINFREAITTGEIVLE